MAAISYRCGHRSSESGGAMLELALTIPLVLSLLLGAADLFRVVFLQVAMFDAVGRAGRYAALGFKEPELDPIRSVRSVVERFSGTQLADSNFKLCSFDANNTQTFRCKSDASKKSRGNFGDWMYLEASQPVKVFFGQMTLNIRASTTFRNEPTMVIKPTSGGTGNPGGGSSGGGKMDAFI